jgi:hypothetical protein
MDRLWSYSCSLATQVFFMPSSSLYEDIKIPLKLIFFNISSLFWYANLLKNKKYFLIFF